MAENSAFRLIAEMVNVRRLKCVYVCPIVAARIEMVGLCVLRNVYHLEIWNLNR